MTEAQALLQRAVALRDAQDTAGALDAILGAANLAPDDANVALGVAQVSFEAGLPAADLYARAAALSPARLDLQRSRATALAAEGRQAEGEALLEYLLGTNPAWIDGHRCLCAMRATAGEADFARSFVAAIAREPENVGLRMVWFHVLATAKKWSAAQAVIAEAEAALGERQAAGTDQLLLALADPEQILGLSPYSRDGARSWAAAMASAISS